MNRKSTTLANLFNAYVTKRIVAYYNVIEWIGSPAFLSQEEKGGGLRRRIGNENVEEKQRGQDSIISWSIRLFVPSAQFRICLLWENAIDILGDSCIVGRVPWDWFLMPALIWFALSHKGRNDEREVSLLFRWPFAMSRGVNTLANRHYGFQSSIEKNHQWVGQRRSFL